MNEKDALEILKSGAEDFKSFPENGGSVPQFCVISICSFVR